jgi:hypothetical protein
MVVDLLSKRAKSDPMQSQKVKDWVREIFQIAEDTTVMVTELQCAEPGCPPLETVIAILKAGNARTQHKLHKSLAEVTHADVAALAASRTHAT